MISYKSNVIPHDANVIYDETYLICKEWRLFRDGENVFRQDADLHYQEANVLFARKDSRSVRLRPNGGAAVFYFIFGRNRSQTAMS